MPIYKVLESPNRLERMAARAVQDKLAVNESLSHKMRTTVQAYASSHTHTLPILRVYGALAIHESVQGRHVRPSAIPA